MAYWECALAWVTLAFVNAGIAQAKNRSGLTWFGLSLPLGPVATFLLVVFFDHRRPKPDVEA